MLALVSTALLTLLSGLFEVTTLPSPPQKPGARPKVMDSTRTAAAAAEALAVVAAVWARRRSVPLLICLGRATDGEDACRDAFVVRPWCQ